MPESRDRLSRPVDVAAMFSRLQSVGSEVLVDESERRINIVGLRSRGLGRGSFRTPRAGRENALPRTGRRGRVRPSSSVLPSWYPRTPLRDITSIVRAIERGRARLREIEGQQLDPPTLHHQNDLTSAPASSAQPEHDISMVSPSPTVGIKRFPPSVGKLPKILFSAASPVVGEFAFLTPQKQLLNSIDTVEKVVKEELEKLKKTPSAKREEREKKIRTLKSMR